MNSDSFENPPIVSPGQPSLLQEPSAAALPGPYLSPGNIPLAISPIATKPPGPGILISFCWLLALIGAQIGFGIVAFIVIGAISVASGMQVDFNNPNSFKELYESGWASQMLLAASQFSTMFVALAAVAVHARSNFAERLELRLPALRHWALGMLAVIPMSILATEAAIIVGELDGFSLKYLQESLNGVNAVPYASVLVFGCLFPGLFEELFFRGVLGRGMTGKWGPSLLGTGIGVGFASLFFGMAHMIPAHVASAALMGVFLHLAFLYSRSFWVPVSMHIVNNAMAFTLSRYENIMPIPGYTSDMGGETISHISPQLFCAGFFATLALMLCWRQVRAKSTDEVNKAPETQAAPLGLGWLLIVGVLLTQAILVVALTMSVEKM